MIFYENVMVWNIIMVSIGALCREIYRIAEMCVFEDHAIQHQRCSMQEQHGKAFKIGVIFDMRLGSDFWSEIHKKGL